MSDRFVGDDEMWAIAKEITRSQYDPQQFVIAYVLLAIVNVLMFILRKTNPLLASILLIVGYLLVTLTVRSSSKRLYAFMKNDGRSTADYIVYKRFGLYSLLCLVGPVVFFAGRNAPGWLGVILTVICALIDAFLVLLTQIPYEEEFGPGNGRYTFSLKVMLSQQMSQEQLQALCKQYNIPF